MRTDASASGFDLLVIGEINADLLLYGDVTPTFGQAEKLLDDAVLTLGGSSALVAHGAAKLGLRVAFIGKVGADTFGESMVRTLSDAGVDVSGIVVDPYSKTGLTVHLVRGSDRAMLTHAGTIAELRPEDVDVALLNKARHVHLGSYFLQRGIQAGLPTLFASARRAGVTTSIDSGWDPDEVWDSGLRHSLGETDVFMPNEQELLRIAGKSSLEEALEELADVPSIVIKRGASGAVLYRDGVESSCSPPKVQPVDATGAGDSFDAGFIYGLSGEGDLNLALELGCVCGALSTTGAGGAEAQPTLDDLLKIYEFDVKGDNE